MCSQYGRSNAITTSATNKDYFNFMKLIKKLVLYVEVAK